MTSPNWLEAAVGTLALVGVSLLLTSVAYKFIIIKGAPPKSGGE